MFLSVHGTTSQKSTFARIEVLIIRRNTVSLVWGWKITVSIVTKLRTMTAEKLSDSQQEQHIFRFSEVFRSVLQPNQNTAQWVPEAFHVRFRRPRCEVDQSFL